MIKSELTELMPCSQRRHSVQPEPSGKQPDGFTLDSASPKGVGRGNAQCNYNA